MKKQAKIVKLIVLMLFVLSTFNAPALAGKIEKYLERGEYAQARGAIKKDLNKNKPQAYFNLVKIALAEKKYWEAARTVNNIVIDGISDGYKEANFIKEAGFNLLRQGKTDVGTLLLKTASKTNVSLYKIISQEAIEIAEECMYQKKFNMGVYLLNFAYTQNEAIKRLPPAMHKDYDPNLKIVIANLLSQASSIADNPMYSCALLAMACKFSPDYKADLNNQLIDLYKDKPRSVRKKIVTQYKFYITSKTKKILLPAPIWKKVTNSYREIKGNGINVVTYVGKGLSMKRGWRVVAKTKNNLTFKHYYAGRNNSYTGGFTLPIVNDFTVKKGLEFFIPKDEIVIYWAEKKIYK